MTRALFFGRVSHGYRRLPCWRNSPAYRVLNVYTARQASSTSTIGSANVSSLETGHINLEDNEGLVFVNSENLRVCVSGIGLT